MQHVVLRFCLGVTLPGGTPYCGVYIEALPVICTFFRFQVCKRVGGFIS